MMTNPPSAKDELFTWLRHMNKYKGSDLFITTNFPPAMKVDGKIMRLTDEPLSAEKCMEIAFSIMSTKQIEEFSSTNECNFAISARGIGRFRVSAFYQRNLAGMVLRRIEVNIPTVEQLRLPEIIKKLAMTKRGLVIFVGATGTGKSTSLASMIGYRNQNSTGHIITIEDPIEFVHKHEGCIITQREVGIDTDSWENALKNTLRQAPDVIMIGEVRTREGMDHAIVFAETGHLVLCTLHANNANQAMDRIINFFPEDRRNQLLMDLSLNLKGVVFKLHNRDEVTLSLRKDGEEVIQTLKTRGQSVAGLSERNEFEWHLDKVKLDLKKAAENRDKVLAEWEKRYATKSEPK